MRSGPIFRNSTELGDGVRVRRADLGQGLRRRGGRGVVGGSVAAVSMFEA